MTFAGFAMLAYIKAQIILYCKHFLDFDLKLSGRGT